MNETVQIITQFINSVGFPIAACAYLAYFQNKTMKEFTEVLHNNTTALEKLITVIHKTGVIEDEDQ